MTRLLRPWSTGEAADAVVIAPDALTAMRREADRGLPSETGGVLVGCREPDGPPTIAHATGPGPRAFRTATRFRRDGDYAQVEVDRLHATSGGRDDYLGEWHSHPAPVGASGLDLDGMAWIGGNAAYRTAEPLLVILRRTLWRRWRPLAYRWRDGLLVPLRLGPANRR